jgi:hypothetical protein
MILARILTPPPDHVQQFHQAAAGHPTVSPIVILLLLLALVAMWRLVFPPRGEDVCLRTNGNRWEEWRP